jgi:HK97 family phage portal protein
MGMFVRYRPGTEQRMLTFISPPVGPYTQALQDQSSGDPEGAMRHDTVWGCVNKIALSMAMLRPLPYRGPMVGHGQATPLDPPLILTKPGSDLRMSGFTYAVWVSKLWRGNAYGMIAARDGRSGRPTQIELQHPDQMKVRKLQFATRDQQAGEYEYKLRGEVVDPASVWHEAILRPPGSRIGMSPLTYAARATRTGQLAEKFGSDYFQDGGHPTAILANKNAAKIEQGQATTVKEKFLAALHGSREPVVLAQGWEYQQIQITPEESQFLNTQAVSGEKICRFFFMKPQHMGIAPSGSSLTYASLEDNLLDFLTYPMTPFIVSWEEELADLIPYGQYVKCDTSPLLRTDMLNRMTSYHMMIGSRGWTQDEVRALEDYPPLTDAQREEVNALVMPLPPPVAPVRQGE